MHSWYLSVERMAGKHGLVDYLDPLSPGNDGLVLPKESFLWAGVSMCTGCGVVLLAKKSPGFCVLSHPIRHPVPTQVKGATCHPYEYVRKCSLWTRVHWGKLINIPTFTALNSFDEECIQEVQSWGTKGIAHQNNETIFKFLRNAELRNK